MPARAVSRCRRKQTPEKTCQIGLLGALISGGVGLTLVARKQQTRLVKVALTQHPHPNLLGELRYPSGPLVISCESHKYLRKATWTLPCESGRRQALNYNEQRPQDFNLPNQPIISVNSFFISLSVVCPQVTSRLSQMIWTRANWRVESGSFSFSCSTGSQPNQVKAAIRGRGGCERFTLLVAKR